MDKTGSTGCLTRLKQRAAAAPGRIGTVALLYGGTCGEREVSIASGTNVRRVLEKEGLHIHFIDTGRAGFVEELIATKPDVAFIALHGTGGEDGCIQGLLEMLGIPYTHSGVTSSALAMDKAVTKILYKDCGLATAAYVELPHGLRPKTTELDAILARIGLPCVVKPTCDGSSLGVSLPKTREEVEVALDEGFAISDTLLIEEFIKGVEVTVPVLGNWQEEPLALPVIEIIPKNEFYDYESKYADGGSTHLIPARITAESAERCSQAAIAAHAVLKCAGISRTDMIVSEDGTPWLIETNTVPGMTHTSLIPESARHFGLTDGELYLLLLDFALEQNQE